MIVTPIPVSLALGSAGMVPVDVSVMMLLPIHVVSAVFICVPLVIILVVRIVVALVVIGVILRQQIGGGEQRHAQRQGCQYLFHSLYRVLQPIELDPRRTARFRFLLHGRALSPK